MKQSDTIEEQFERYNTQIENKQGLYDSLRKNVSDLSIISRKLSFGVNKLCTMLETSNPITEALTKDRQYSDSIFHQHPEFLEAATGYLTICSELKPIWEEILVVVNEYNQKNNNFLNEMQFCSEQWRNQLSPIISSTLLLHFLVTGQLLTYEKTISTLCIPSEIRLPLEEYLGAVATLPNELPRFAIGAVHMKMYHIPSALYSFSNNLFSAMKLINMKNDGLRKKFDSMKYANSKLSDITFDLEIRHLDK